MIRLFPVAALLAGCTSQLNVGGPCAPFGTGEEPCRQQIYFPTGVAYDADAPANTTPVLYVASSNADLRYSGGTVSAVDLERFECAVAFARDGSIAPGCDQLAFAIPLTDGTPAGGGTLFHLADKDPTDAEGRTVREVDAAGCRQDLLDPRILECDETRFIASAVKVGNFAGAVRVQTRGDPSAGQRRLWLPVRGDPSITFVGVQRHFKLSTDPNVHDKLPSVAHLDCPDPSNGNPARQLDDCNLQRITVRDFHGDNGAALPACSTDADCPGAAMCPTCTQVTSCSHGQCVPIPLPPEPFGVALDEGPGYVHLAVVHLLGGEVTLIDASVDDPTSTSDITPKQKVVLDVKKGLFTANAAGQAGGFALAPLHAGAPPSTPSFWYVTSRLSPQVAMFRVDPAGLILPQIAFNLAGGPYLAGDDVRDVAVQPDGERAFFVENHPPTVFTVDTRPAESSPDGLPVNQVVDIVDVCQGPSHLGLRQWSDPGAEGAPPRTTTRLYVVCFTTGQVAVVDPDLALVADSIISGRGPNDITFNFGGGLAEPPHRRAYVSNFTDSTVSVIDLDRGSPTENRTIARIGVSSPPSTM